MSYSGRSSAFGKPSILLGRRANEEGRTIGFHLTPQIAATDELIEDASDSHILAVAPTGGGKGLGLLIPNALNWPGGLIVVDPKGEAAMVTARRRREMGQETFILDPFNVVTSDSAKFDPLCRLKRNGPFLIDDAFACAALLSSGRRSSQEYFWDDLSEGLEAGLMVHVATSPGETDRTLGRVYDLLTSDDVVYQLAVMLDSKAISHPFAYRQIAAFLQHEGEKVRTSVRSTAQQHMKVFASAAVRRAVQSTSFDIEALRAGKPLTIYIVVPPRYLTSHAALIRLWLSTLVDIITDRQHAPELPTLFIVDEMHALGPIPLLKQVITLLRGYGLRAIMVLQNLDQLNDLFPHDASTVVNNCNIVTFAHKNLAMSHAMTTVLGDVSAQYLFRMGHRKIAIQRAGIPTEIGLKLNYTLDPLFAGQFDPNPYVPQGKHARNGERVDGR